MALILGVETATPVCSVALIRDGEVMARLESHRGNDHSALLTVFVEQMLKESGIALSDLHAVAVSKGPGSYTGLRIGVSAAKGYCYALSIPLIAVPTLLSMAAGMLAHDTMPGRHQYFCPMIDARRMEVYASVYDSSLRELSPVTATVITKDSFSTYLEQGPVIFFGNGAMKTRDVLGDHPNAVFDAMPASAAYMGNLAETFYQQKRFEDVAYFEPFYLKDFIAGKPRVKGL